MSINDSRLHTVNDIFNRMSKDFVTVDGNVKKIQRENLTSYKVATVILIKVYCNESTKGIIDTIRILIIIISNDTFMHVDKYVDKLNLIFCSNRGETRFLFSVVKAHSGN